MSESNNAKVLNSSDVTKICRLCLKSTTFLQPLQESSLLECLRKISKLPLKLEPRWPKNICEQCTGYLSQLKQFTIFLAKCKHSQRVLHEFFFDQTKLDAGGVKIEQKDDIGTITMKEDTDFGEQANDPLENEENLQTTSVEDNENSRKFTENNHENMETVWVKEETCNDDIEDIISETFSEDSAEDLPVEAGPKSGKRKQQTKPYKRKPRGHQMCDRCGSLVSGLTTHKRTKCANTKCPQCDYVASEPLELRKHYTLKHSKSRTACPKCQQLVPDIYVHRKENKQCQFKCDFCEHTSLKRAWIRKHMNTHSDVKRFICDTCGVSFRYCSNLTRHKKLHDFGPQYTCTLCPRKFSTKAHMQGHMNHQHYGIKPYKCHYCDESFSYIMTRSAHAKKEHKNEYVPIVRNTRVLNYKTKDLSESCVENSKHFACEQCKKSYKTEATFHAHVLKHDRDALQLQSLQQE